jgi:hypothetical protein
VAGRAGGSRRPWRQIDFDARRLARLHLDGNQLLAKGVCRRADDSGDGHGGEEPGARGQIFCHGV